MKYDVSYTRKTTEKTVFYSEDNELNFFKSLVDASSDAEAIKKVKDEIIELMLCNCLEIETKENELLVSEPSDHEFIEGYYNFNADDFLMMVDKNQFSINEICAFVFPTQPLFPLHQNSLEGLSSLTTNKFGKQYSMICTRDCTNVEITANDEVC